MATDNGQVVILGANGVMGAVAAAVFAGAGYRVMMLARDLDKARQALTAAKNAVRAEGVGEFVTPGSYDADLATAVAGASIVFEALAEDLALKRTFFALIDAHRRPDAIVATNSSGLSIAAMAAGMSDSFRRHFMGVHLYNPPHVIVGAELIPNPDTDPAVLEAMRATLGRRLGRKVIVTRDRPAFVGNRVGFRVMNEVAQLAAEHGVALVDYIVGPQTGRAMAPLATVDLVGWDVHKAIVDNVYVNCAGDQARGYFKLPAYMERGVAEGRLGDKTPDRGGFYRRAAGRTIEVLDPAAGTYQPYIPPRPIEFVERMKALNRVGRYRAAQAVMAAAAGAEADLARRVVMGYVSYALSCVGEVAYSHGDVDTIMSYGFNWTPPCVIVDLLGARETIAMFGRYHLPVPPVVEQAAQNGVKLFTGGVLEYGRTFVG
ncbi:MAG: 3-hydroxyacyl-CoA dehydrogenase family protein [Candidatus Binataceae bacterium]|nr:3-hydroxyacyl-CoA dehydrogenase family protein [Candidatus Binataceae bacterium]